MSTLYRREDSPYVWWSSLYRGKRLRKSTGMRQMTLAKQVQLQWDMKLFKGDISFVNSPNLPTANLNAFMDEYLKLRARRSYNTGNFAASVSRKFKVYLDSISIVSITDVNTKVLDGYIDFLDCAAKTKHNHLKEIKIMFDKAINDDLMLKNPALLVTLPKVVKKVKHRMLDRIDLDIIFENAGGYRLYFEFLYCTGLRAGDTAMLKYGNIDFKRSLIIGTVRKSGRVHEFPLANALLQKLKSEKKDIPLFPTLYANTERKLNDNLAKPRKFMQALLKAHDRPKATLHSFRVTFNNTLRDLGLSMDDRQILLAHSSSETTKIYTHPNVELAREWIDRLPFFNQPDDVTNT